MVFPNTLLENTWTFLSIFEVFSKWLQCIFELSADVHLRTTCSSAFPLRIVRVVLRRTLGKRPIERRQFQLRAQKGGVHAGRVLEHGLDLLVVQAACVDHEHAHELSQVALLDVACLGERLLDELLRAVGRLTIDTLCCWRRKLNPHIFLICFVTGLKIRTQSKRLAVLVDVHAELANVADRALDALVGLVQVAHRCLSRRCLRRCRRRLLLKGELREVLVLELLSNRDIKRCAHYFELYLI